MIKLLSLIRADTRSIFRDVILMLSLLGPLLIALVLRIGLPLATAYLQDVLDFDLTPFFPLILVFQLFLSAMIIGVLVGFIILDDRDENILVYLAVTPLSMSSYLVYRLLSPAVISFLITIIAVKIGDVTTLSIAQLLPVILLASLEAPMSSLFLASYASNKVEGLALSKILGILFVAPVVAVLVDSVWRFAAAILPPFWLAQGVYTVGQTQGWLWLVVGALVHVLMLSMLFRKFVYRVSQV